MTDQSADAAPDGAGPIEAHAHWLLRLALVSVFLFHGVQKFLDLDAGAAMTGLPVPVWALVALAEVGGSVLLIAGGVFRTRLGDRLTRLGALAFAPVMLGAVFMVHWGRWSFTPSDSHPMGGMEFQVVLLLLSLFFVLRGNHAR